MTIRVQSNFSRFLQLGEEKTCGVDNWSIFIRTVAPSQKSDSTSSGNLCFMIYNLFLNNSWSKVRRGATAAEADYESTVMASPSLPPFPPTSPLVPSPVAVEDLELPRPVSFCPRGTDCTYHEVKKKLSKMLCGHGFYFNADYTLIHHWTLEYKIPINFKFKF